MTRIGGKAGTTTHAVSTRRTAVLGLAVLALVFSTASPRLARPGDPDLGFGPGSTVKDTAIGAESAEAGLLLPDGRMVVAGYRTSGGTADFLLARYNSVGGSDFTFGAAGKTFTNVGASGSNDYAHALAAYPSGKLVAAGEADNGANRDFAVARYSSEGVVDGTFDTDGKVLTDFGGFNDQAHAVVVNGTEATAVGRSFNGTDSDVALARFNDAGALLAGFDGDGKVLTDLDDEGALAAVMQPDGKVVAAGFAGSAADHDIALFRYNADGTLDTSFGGGDGIATTAVGGGNDEARAIARQADGKLVVAGTTDNGSNDDIAVARYNTDGTLDTSFGGGDGVSITDIGAGASDQGNGIAVQPDGRIVVVGTTMGGTDANVAVVRYNSDGSVDTGTFGNSGIAVRGGPHADEGRSVLVQDDTRILLTGSFDRGVDPGLGLLRALGQTVQVNDTAVVVPASVTAVARFTVSLAVPGLDTVAVNYFTTNGSAAAGTDYAFTSGTLTFNPGETTKFVDETVLPSGAVEPDQTLFLNLASPTKATLADGQGIATLINKKATKYWMVAADGGIFAFNTPFLGSMGGVRLNSPIVGMAARPDGNGYWMVAADGGIFAFNAPFRGSTGGIRLNSPIVGMSSTPDGNGYWMVAADGGMFAFNAPFRGSMGGVRLNRPVVGMASTPSGGGYWMVASDGGMFAFNAPFFGSMGGSPLNQPIVGMAPHPSGNGYWMVARDGGIFAFGNARFFGSTGGIRLNSPIVGMAASPSGNGYWLFAADGGLFAFGDAEFSGSAAGIGIRSPIVGGAGGAA